jgi:methylthioribose-1-phosphate isomerase
VSDGIAEIPIEERDPREVTHVQGATGDGIASVRVTPDGTPARNDAFDVTPARLVSAFITERGVAAASEQGLAALFPEMAARRA